MSTPKKKYRYVTGCEALYVRTTGDVSSKPLAIVKQGDRLQLLEDGPLWAHILSADGVEGYCMTAYLSKTRGTR